MDGLQKQIVLRAKIIGIDGSSYSGEAAEQLIDEAAQFGKKLDLYQLQKQRALFVDKFARCPAQMRR